MNRLFSAAIGLLIFSSQATAQPKKSGAIQFESSFDPAAMATANGIKLTDEMIARMPKSSVNSFELMFNLTNASYMKVEDVDDSNNSGAGAGGGMRFGGFGTNRDYYYSFPDHKLTEVFELSDTTYFLQSKLGVSTQNGGFGNAQTPPVVEYIKSDETKKILGFNCKKVTVKTTTRRKILEEEKVFTDQTNLWYTDELGFDFSPNPALWTEGTVLAIEGKGTNILAKSIEYRNVSAKDAGLPKKGTVITPDEYKAKMEQRMKQMRGNRNGNRTGQIRNMSIN
jgi:GLPGLI family protein